MMIAARHPDLFAAAASLSGAVDSNLAANGAVLSLSPTFHGAPRRRDLRPARDPGGPLARPQPDRPRRQPARARPPGSQRQRRPEPGDRRADRSPPTASPAWSRIGSTWPASTCTTCSTRCDPAPVEDYGPGCHTMPNFTREIVDTLAVFDDVFADPPPAPSRFDYDRSSRVSTSGAGTCAPTRSGRSSSCGSRTRARAV